MRAASEKTRWLVGGIAGSVFAVILGVSLSQTGEDNGERHPTAETRTRILNANATSEAAYNEQVRIWRKRMEGYRSPQRLRGFVEELIGIEQKFRMGLSLVNSGASDEQRTRILFRKHVIDDGRLVSDMNAAVASYQTHLFKKDLDLIKAAGGTSDQWLNAMTSAKSCPSSWHFKMWPVFMRAVEESRNDAVKFLATTAAADAVGDRIKKSARQSGWDTTKEGSWSDALTGLLVDASAGLLIDQATDGTEKIMSRLSSEMLQAEHELLDGPDGLFAILRSVTETHQKYLDSLVSATGKQ
jgi:hypothetical protein